MITSFLRKRGKKFGMLGGALAIGGAYLDYNSTKAEALEEGDSEGLATAKGAATAAGWLLAEPLMWGLTIAKGVGTVADLAFSESHNIRQRYEAAAYQQFISRTDGERYAVLGGTFVDNEQAATLRQRQMALMRQHRIATETILGSEARQLHR